MIEYKNLYKGNLPYFKEFNTVFNQVLDSGWFVLGRNVEEFEKEFANYLNVNHCVGVASGLDALTISLMVLEFMKSLRFSISEEIHRTTLSLPISSFYTIGDIQQVIKIINNFK